MSARATISNYITSSNFPNFWKKIIEDWPSFSKPDRMIFFTFLYNQKQYRTMVALIIHDLSMDSPNTPWLYFFRTLKKHNLSTPKQHTESIVDYFSVLGISIPKPNNPKDIVANLSEKNTTDFKKYLANRKHELLTEYKIAEAEKLEEQKKIALVKLEKLFPMEKENQRPRAVATDEEIEIGHSICKQYGKNLIKIRDFIDFSIQLHLFGLTNLAISVLREAPSSEAKFLYLLQFQFLSRQYIENITLFEEIKETQFYRWPSVNRLSLYTLARSYWELGEKKLAIQNLTHLEKKAPYYRDTTDRLLIWKEAAR